MYSGKKCGELGKVDGRRLFPGSDAYGLASLIASVAIGCASLSMAHEGIEFQIGEINDEIRASGSSVNLLERRAYLYLEHREWDRSLADYRAILDWDPTLNSARLGVAQCYLGKEDVGRGLMAVNLYLESSADDFQGRLCRARLLVEQGRLDAASVDYEKALGNRPRNNSGVETYFEWAQKLRRGGAKWYSEALRVIDSGIKVVGSNIALEELAIGIEVDSGNLSGALTRIDGVLGGALGKSPRWLLWRAEILEASKRPGEALEAYRKTLATIGEIPARRRNVAAVRKIEAKAIAKINHLES